MLSETLKKISINSMNQNIFSEFTISYMKNISYNGKYFSYNRKEISIYLKFDVIWILKINEYFGCKSGKIHYLAGNNKE